MPSFEGSIFLKSTNKKVLLVDTNRASVPIYKSLTSQGLQVTVVGGDPNETLAKMAKDYISIDYSDVTALKNLIAQEQYDYIVPGCTDLSYQVCSKIGQGKFLGVDTQENTDIVNSKNRFRALCLRLSIPVPKTLTVEQAKNSTSIIIKPVDSFSGRGITVLQNSNPDAINQAFGKACEASKTKTALIEEYVEGQLYSYSAFIQKKKVVSDFFVQEDATTNPFTVDTSRVVDTIKSDLRQRLQENIESIARELNLVDGLMHTQFIEKKGQYWVIEMTRRCPGDIYSLLIEFSTGYDYAANYAASFTGNPIIPVKNNKVKCQIIRHTITSKEGELFWGVQFQQAIEIKLFVPLVTSGDYISPSPYGRLGIFFLKVQSANEYEKIYQKLLSRELYTLNYN
jgi:carbamoylphosphate synthase large subunit